jgi:hypothetical protein
MKDTPYPKHLRISRADKFKFSFSSKIVSWYKKNGKEELK